MSNGTQTEMAPSGAEAWLPELSLPPTTDGVPALSQFHLGNQDVPENMKGSFVN